jgi:hypothetical protein
MDGATVAVLLTEVTAAFVPLPGEPLVRLGSGPQPDIPAHIC